MNITQETSRKPNYFKDIEYGKIGEIDFENNIVGKINKRGYSLFDVRDERNYQNCDIDYVIDKNGKDKLPPIETVLEDKIYVKIEVKLDSRAISTSNIPYELVSHSSSGWCVTTKCDYVYMVLTEKDNSKILKRLWIDMKKWHEFCANRKKGKKLSIIEDEMELWIFFVNYLI